MRPKQPKPPTQNETNKADQERKMFLSRKDVHQCLKRLRRKHEKGELKIEEDWAKEIKWILGKLDLHEGYFHFF